MITEYSGEVLAGQSALLLDFKKADYDTVVKTDKLVVLYFYANWCPICRVEFPVMQKAFNELNTDKVVGFRVNYKDNQTDDDEENLARQFGVAYQHTKVFFKNGQRILKSPEGWGQERYSSEINKFIK
jgi:thiol-disulfide isomerase/thioredoxin